MKDKGTMGSHPSRSNSDDLLKKVMEESANEFDAEGENDAEKAIAELERRSAEIDLAVKNREKKKKDPSEPQTYSVHEKRAKELEAQVLKLDTKKKKREKAGERK